MMNQVGSTSILGTPISNTSYADACDRIEQWTLEGQPGYIVAANVHVVMTGYWQADYRQVLQRAMLVTPDGMPLVWGLRLLGVEAQQRVYGPDLMLEWCDRAAQIGSAIYLYGGTPEMLARMQQYLQMRCPGLKIAGCHSPPFRPLTPDEEQLDAGRINQSGADVVFVGLGCPKQELWMARQVGQVQPVMVGVGAAFSFYSGEVAQAPRWMMRFGLEWLFRLCQEPQRLWSRYLVNNGAFVVLFALQLVRHCFGPGLGKPSLPSSES